MKIPTPVTALRNLRLNDVTKVVRAAAWVQLQLEDPTVQDRKLRQEMQWDAKKQTYKVQWLFSDGDARGILVLSPKIIHPEYKVPDFPDDPGPFYCDVTGNSPTEDPIHQSLVGFDFGARPDVFGLMANRARSRLEAHIYKRFHRLMH